VPASPASMEMRPGTMPLQAATAGSFQADSLKVACMAAPKRIMALSQEISPIPDYLTVCVQETFTYC
jgi:hypothetical protein